MILSDQKQILYEQYKTISGLMLENIPDFLWAKDIRGAYLFANQAMCNRLLKCDCIEEIIGKTDRFFAEREHKLGYDHSLIKNLSNRENSGMDPNKKNQFTIDGHVWGKYLALDIIQIPFANKDGEPAGMIGSARDITKDNHRVGNIQRAISDGIFEWHLITNEVYFSDQLKTILGYGPEELKDEYGEWEKRIHPKDAQKVMLAHNLFAEKDTSRVELEYRLRHKDQTFRWIKSRTVCQRNSKKKSVFLISSITDITEQKRSEQNLKDTNKQLEKRLIQRSKMIEETQTALKVLMEKQEETKKDISENILSNLKGLVLPFIEKLKNESVLKDQMNIIDIIESNLIEIVSSFSKDLMRLNMSLTPTELQVADLVRNGQTNKEISAILNKSVRAIAAHRENLREKLGLKNKKINLKTYLLTVISNTQPL